MLVACSGYCSVSATPCVTPERQWLTLPDSELSHSGLAEQAPLSQSSIVGTHKTYNSQRTYNSERAELLSTVSLNSVPQHDEYNKEQ